MAMKDYRTIVVGTDGSSLAEPTVGRAAWMAKREDADLVIVCAFADLPRRAEAMNVATLGGDARTGQVLGRAAATSALTGALKVADAHGARVGAALLADGEPSVVLVTAAESRGADLIVLGATHRRSLADRVLGWTATEVVKRAQCDVLIVRPEAEGTGDLEVPESS